MRASKLLHRILKFIIMQIYANLFKINEKCHLSSIQKSQQIISLIESKNNEIYMNLLEIDNLY